jgi:putative membrane protein
VNSAQTFLLAETWMHGGWGWGWMTLMMVVMVLFWGAVIFGIVWLIRSVARGGSTPMGAPVSRESPLEILDRHFAEGALTPEDYRARREVLVRGFAESSGAPKDKPLTAPQVAERR